MKHLRNCHNLPPFMWEEGVRIFNTPGVSNNFSSHNTILGENIGNLINPNKYWGLIRFGRLPQMFHLICWVERLGTQSIPMNHWDLIGFSIFPMFLIIYWEGLKRECFTSLPKNNNICSLSLLPMIFSQGHTSQFHVACLTKVCQVQIFYLTLLAQLYTPQIKTYHMFI